MKKHNRIIVSVSNDLFTDQRVFKICNTISLSGFEPFVIGRILPKSNEMPISYFKHKRMKLFFEKGFLFYAELNIRLFFKLLVTKYDALYANDLDTLLPNFLCSKIFNKPLIYDSHELFTEVPELDGRFAKKIWLLIEKAIFPKLKNVFTVNASIADFYSSKYKVECHIMRNVPLINFDIIPFKKSSFDLAENTSIIILQGAGINIDRGAEEAVEMMNYIENAVLFIVGGGDVINSLKEKVIKEHLEKNVRFFDKQHYIDLLAFTAMADIGLSLDKNTNLNYRFSLPNKVFDYIHAGTPIVASNLDEIANIIKTFEVGKVSESHNPKILANICNEMLQSNCKSLFKPKLKEAAQLLNWQVESKKLSEILQEIQ